jgi:hypothetical protein
MCGTIDHGHTCDKYLVLAEKPVMTPGRLAVATLRKNTFAAGGRGQWRSRAQVGQQTREAAQWGYLAQRAGGAVKWRKGMGCHGGLGRNGLGIRNGF